MSGWETKPLGDVAYLAGRIGWKGLTAKEYTAEGPLFLSVHSLNYGDYVDFRDAFHISQERFDESPEIMLQDGDVLICKDGAGIGKVGIVDNIPGPSTINSSLLLIRAFEGVEPKYLYFALCSPSFQKMVQERIDGATTPHLYQREIRTFPILVPPLAEQRRIVATLDGAFAGLTKMRANAEANLKNARALFDSHLNSVFSEAGEGWRSVTLEEVSGIESSLVDPREAAYLDLPHIGAGNMVSMTGEIVDVKTAREEKLISGKFLFDREAVLYSKIRPYLMKACLPNFNGLCSADVYPLKPKPGRLDRTFLYHLLMSNRFTEYAIAGSARAGMPKVNRDHLFAYTFALPPIAVQVSLAQRFDALLAASRELEAINRSRLRAVDELKQSILARALAGEMTPAPLVAASMIVAANDNRSRTAAIIARAFARHRRRQRDWSFGHVKAQKTLHMVEAVAEYELDRVPIKDAAGPNDMPHMGRAERWAEDNRHFRFRKVGEGYRLEPMDGFDALLRQADAIDTMQLRAIDRVIDIFIPMDMREAELFATVYAAWNNLLIDGATLTDDTIIREARDDWHHKKLDIDRSEFVKALAAVRKSGMIPTGKGKRVGEPQARFL